MPVLRRILLDGPINLYASTGCGLSSLQELCVVSNTHGVQLPGLLLAGAMSSLTDLSVCTLFHTHCRDNCDGSDAMRAISDCTRLTRLTIGRTGYSSSALPWSALGSLGSLLQLNLPGEMPRFAQSPHGLAGLESLVCLRECSVKGPLTCSLVRMLEPVVAAWTFLRMMRILRLTDQAVLECEMDRTEFLRLAATARDQEDWKIAKHRNGTWLWKCPTTVTD
jgi:hypothetical protein